MTSSSVTSNGPDVMAQHLNCSICLDVFQDPVTTSCGHSFCKVCLSRSSQHNDLSCPLCKQFLVKNPEVNVVLRGLVEQLKTNRVQRCTGNPGEVACDVCTGGKVKALKSCLVCLASYCEIHLKTHSLTERLKGHKLVGPVEDLDKRACLTHGRPLELYVRKDQQCVCVLCVEEGQKVVSIEQESERKKTELGDTKAELQQKIKKLEKKTEDIRASAKACKDQLESEWWAIEGVFKAVISAVEEAQDCALRPLNEKRQSVEEEEEKLTKELQQEIDNLNKTICDLDKMATVEDHILFLQTFPSLSDLDDSRDWTDVEVDTSTSFGSIRTITAAMMEQVEQEVEKLATIELQRMPKFTVDVKLDPVTAHARLVLSNDGKEVRDGGEFQEVSDGPERFDHFSSVLGINKLTSGKSYWEVEVGHKTGWDLGVASSAVNPKGKLSLTPENGFWATVQYGKGSYAALTAPPTGLSLKVKPQTVGVFVDYEEGLVSFYDVTACSHIYSFTRCSFTGQLHPYFSPHLKLDDKNGDPLIISPVKHK